MLKPETQYPHNAKESVGKNRFCRFIRRYGVETLKALGLGSVILLAACEKGEKSEAEVLQEVLGKTSITVPGETSTDRTVRLTDGMRIGRGIVTLGGSSNVSETQWVWYLNAFRRAKKETFRAQQDLPAAMSFHWIVDTEYDKDGNPTNKSGYPKNSRNPYTDKSVNNAGSEFTLSNLKDQIKKGGQFLVEISMVEDERGRPVHREVLMSHLPKESEELIIPGVPMRVPSARAFSKAAIDSLISIGNAVPFSDTLRIESKFNTGWGSDGLVRGLTKSLKVDGSTVYNHFDNEELHSKRMLFTDFHEVNRKNREGYAREVAFQGVKLIRKK